jgi:redox-sensing transcriptional repressor
MRSQSARAELETGTASMHRRHISESTIRRLSVYYRALAALDAEGYHTISSQELATRERLTPAQVRKDLSAFGSFGTRGLGYPAKELHARIGQILGIDREWNVGIVGVGHLGSALVSYREFQKQGFLIKALFDNDQRKIGSNHKGVTIADIRDLGAEIKKQRLAIVIIAVPAAVAQSVCDMAVAAGVKGILNFAPIRLKVPSEVVVRTENMAMELEFVSFHLAQRLAREPSAS